MATFCSLYSSSSGNCTYIGSSGGGILIDIGVSAKRTETALKEIGVDPNTIGAVFVTHEHNDHISGIRVFASRYNIKVYATEGTLIGMDNAGVFKSRVDAYIIPQGGMVSQGMFIKPFRISHDANEPTGFTVTLENGKKAAVATDTGVVTQEMKENLPGCELILLESNHDINMLRMGSYPYILKQRILSDKGHLSNDASATFAADLTDRGAKHIILGHLSKENNIPALAYETAKCSLEAKGLKTGKDINLQVAGSLNPPILF